MKLYTFPTVLHGGEIHSVDINSSNSRVLTAGKDGVAVWDYPQLKNCFESKNHDISPLKSYDYHERLIRIARWNPITPNQFVSCDDSGCIFLNTDDTPKKLYPFTSEDTHSTSITDGNWSLDGKYFVWSTSDGKIHLVDINKLTYQELSSLDHSEKPLTQRSVAFDPTNNYLITLNDDTLINLYQYHEQQSGYQFRLIHKISKLLNKTPINVKYKRISWSPDGEFISIPTASKNLTSLISLLSRSQDWTNKISLVGHDLNCEVVRFNPKVYTTDKSDTVEPLNAFHIIATSGSDKTLVVWNTSKDSPLFIIKDVSSKPVVDLAWDKTGRTLFFASLDGHLTSVEFEESELGNQVSDQMFLQLFNFKDKYVKPFNFKYDDGSNKKSSSSAIELLDQKDAIKIFKEGEVKVETTQPTGVEKPAGKHQGVIVPEVLEYSKSEDSHDILQTMVTRSKRAKVPPKTAVANKSVSYDTQKITSKDGKKRIQPMLISKTNKDAAPLLQSSPATTSGASKTLMEFDKPSYLVAEEVFREKRRLKGNQDDNSTKKVKRDLEPVKFIGSIVVNPNLAFSKTRLAIPKVRMNFRIVSKLDNESLSLDIRNGQGNESAPTRITYLKKDKQIWCDFIPRYIQLVTEGTTFWALSTSDGQIIIYSSTSGKRILPPLILGTPLSFLESHGKYLMAVTSVGELYVWDIETKKLHLNSPLSLSPLLELSSKYQEDGLSKSENLTMCSITSKGIPLVTLSNGSGYLFNKDLGTWQTITESWWAFGSHYWDSLNDDALPQTTGLLGNDGSSLIKLLEHKTNEEIIRKSRTDRGKYFNKISKNMIMKEGFENLENTISLSHLENRILCCELLGEASDFKRFLITYAKRICELGHKAKLYDVCSQLLGPVIENEEDDVKLVEDSDWDPKICGLEKRELLKEIILACASNRDAQRVLIHFAKRIGGFEVE